MFHNDRDDKNVDHASISPEHHHACIASLLATLSPLPSLLPFVAIHVPSAGSYVKDMVASKPLVVFSKTYCPYCTKAKTALKAVGAKYEVSPKNEKHAVLCTAAVYQFKCALMHTWYTLTKRLL